MSSIGFLFDFVRLDTPGVTETFSFDIKIVEKNILRPNL